ncbi:hypothetical protein MXB_5363 [Myxobolus squamalis]|nr:hypothetical protein MXB_5363 [Myxobolus squamalis]
MSANALSYDKNFVKNYAKISHKESFAIFLNPMLNGVFLSEYQKLFLKRGNNDYIKWYKKWINIKLETQYLEI